MYSGVSAVSAAVAIALWSMPVSASTIVQGFSGNQGPPALLTLFDQSLGARETTFLNRPNLEAVNSPVVNGPAGGSDGDIPSSIRPSGTLFEDLAGPSDQFLIWSRNLDISPKLYR